MVPNDLAPERQLNPSSRFVAIVGTEYVITAFSSLYRPTTGANLRYVGHWDSVTRACCQPAA